MKKESIFKILIFCILFISACNNSSQNTTQNNSEPATTTDSKAESIAVRNAFNAVISQNEFQQHLDLKDDPNAKINTDYSEIIFGDLDGDNQPDALMSFSVENRGGGNNADFHYAIFLHQNEQWQYQAEVSLGGDALDYIIELNRIENGKIDAVAKGTKDESLPSYQLTYLYKNKDLINTFIELHKGEETENESLEIDGFLNRDLVTIPMQTTLSELKKLLGKVKISIPEYPAECGTFFDDNDIRYFNNDYFSYEVNSKGETAFYNVSLKGSGITVITDKGSLDENTTLEQLKKAFYHSNQWEVSQEDRSIMLFAGDADDSFILYFDKNNKLEMITYHVQC